MRAAIALAVLAFLPGLLDPFMAAKALALRAIGFGLLAWLALGGAPRAPLAAAERALLLALAVLAASTALALSPTLAWRGEVEQREGLLTWLALAALFTAAWRTHAGAAARKRALDTIAVTAAIAAGYALVQFAGFDLFAWNDAARYVTDGFATLRPGATLGNPILLGAVLAPALAIVTARLASGRGDRLLLVAAAAVFACALAATLSRGAWLAAAAGMLVSVTMARPSWRQAALALGSPLLPAFAWSALALRGAPLARLTEGAAASSTPAREAIAQAAFALWRERPWLGTGPDGFGLAFPRVQPLSYWRHDWLGMPAHAHSAPLQLLATTGTLGALALLAWAALSLRPLAAAARKPDGRRECAAECGALAALTVAALFNPLGLAGAAVGIVLLALAASRAQGAAPAQPQGSRAAFAGLLLVALGVTLASAGELRDLALAGRVRGLLEESLRLPPAERAEAVQQASVAAGRLALRAPREDLPWRIVADAQLARSRAAFANGEFAAIELARMAEQAAREALGRAPLRAANRARLAVALSWRARIERADSAPQARDIFAAFDAASRLAPADALVLVERARAEDSLGRYDEALRTARHIVAMYPASAQGHALEGLALLRLGRAGEARVALQRALASEWEAGSEGQRQAAEGLLRQLGTPLPAAEAPPAQ